MGIPTLESVTPMLDSIAVAVLGDTIVYTPAQGAPVTRGFVDLGEAARDFGVSAAVEQDIVVEIRRADLPSRPASLDRLTITALPGKTYQPRDPVIRDTFWRFGVSEVKGV